MNGLPWFPLYASQFLGSRRVRRFSAEQVGIYILLLFRWPPEAQEMKT